MNGKPKGSKTMKTTALAFLLAVSLALPALAATEIKTEEVTYAAEGVTMNGFLAYDSARQGKRPGVLVVHEWWGHNEYARKRARQLAELGYTALAVDMYGAGTQVDHPEDAGKFAGEVMNNLDTARARFEAAMKVLQQHPTVDPQKVAAIGYCFGGGVVLHMARMGVDLDGVVSFHGSLATKTPARKGAVKAAVLVCNGAADPFVTAEQIEAFKEEMKAAGVDLTFVSYEGVKHSFTNPDADSFAKRFNLPLAYDADADRKSWQQMQDLFDRIFH
jgi:dienelactone hydrolase